MTNIKTQPKTAFGRTLHYVIDPVQQDALQSLTGKKTLTETDITIHNCRIENLRKNITKKPLY